MLSSTYYIVNFRDMTKIFLGLHSSYPPLGVVVRERTIFCRSPFPGRHLVCRGSAAPAVTRVWNTNLQLLKRETRFAASKAPELPAPFVSLANSARQTEVARSDVENIGHTQERCVDTAVDTQGRCDAVISHAFDGAVFAQGHVQGDLLAGEHR